MLTACGDLRKKTYIDVIAEVADPQKMLYLCDQAGIIQSIRGKATAIDAPEKFTARKSFHDLPFKFTDDAAAAENGKAIEKFDIWYSTETRFVVRIANYTKTPVTKIIVGFNNGECGTDENPHYDKLMMVTFNPIAPDTERLLKWKIPPGVQIVGGACIDIMRASQE